MGIKNLSGMRFGRLTCIKPVGRYEKGRSIIWQCKCDCGKTINVIGGSLRSGNTQSCGCLQKEKAAASGRESRKHGMIYSGLYKSWAHMKARCLHKSNKSHKDYGGRGIKVCDEWMEFVPFMEWAMANGYQNGLTIERVDNDGNYEPSNCIWATPIIQANNKRNNRRLTLNGKTMTVSQWASALGINASTLHSRLCSGWGTEKALSTPTSKSKPVYIAAERG